MVKRLFKSAFLAMACVAFISVMAMSASAAGTYSLNILFEKEDLERIYSEGMRVVLVKDTVDEGDVPVVWASFAPFENNVIEWNDEYSVYAAGEAIQNLDVIHPAAKRSAVTGVAYAYRGNAFENPRLLDTVRRKEYVIQNCEQSKEAFAFGLAQSIIVNGKTLDHVPINIVNIPLAGYKNMKPSENVMIYLLEKNSSSGTVLDHIEGDALGITYSDTETEHTVIYDNKLKAFKQID